MTGRYNKFNETYNTQKYLYSPEFTTNINYDIKKLNLNISVYNKFSGKREGFFIDSDSNAITKTTRSSFNNLSSTISKSFLKETLQVSFGVKNALNVKDIETLNEIGQAHSRDLELWGRSFFFKKNIYL